MLPLCMGQRSINGPQWFLRRLNTKNKITCGILSRSLPSGTGKEAKSGTISKTYKLKLSATETRLKSTGERKRQALWTLYQVA